MSDDFTLPHPWQPMDRAPKGPTTAIHVGEGIPWTVEQGPELALICWHCGDVGHVLIRGAWHTRDGRRGEWRDLECGEPIDFAILGWARMPTTAEMEPMVEAYASTDCS